MAEERSLVGARTWFYDERTPARRMGVAMHPDRGLVVVSLWQADTCTATFRLRLVDSARLIAALADGMAAGLPASVAEAEALAKPRRWRGLLWFSSFRSGGPPTPDPPPTPEPPHLRAL